jgi:hypothetical protein
MRLIRRIFFIAVLGVATLLGALWLEHWIPVTLPVPTGPFAVGRATYAWSDAAHSDLVWIWYPAAAAQSPALTEDYLPAPWRSAIYATRAFRRGRHPTLS